MKSHSQDVTIDATEDQRRYGLAIEKLTLWFAKMVLVIPGTLKHPQKESLFQKSQSEQRISDLRRHKNRRVGLMMLSPWN